MAVKHYTMELDDFPTPCVQLLKPCIMGHMGEGLLNCLSALRTETGYISVKTIHVIIFKSILTLQHFSPVPRTFAQYGVTDRNLIYKHGC